MPERPRWLAAAALVAVGATIGVVAAALSSDAPRGEPAAAVTVSVTHTAVVTPSPTPTPTPTASAPGFDLSARSVDNADSLWVVVNKTHPLAPLRYVPGDLVRVDVPGTPTTMRAEAAAALKAMYEASSKSGAPFLVLAGYRSFTVQDGVHRSYVSQQGRAYADRVSARPGFSEHQTGLAVDVYDPHRCLLNACYADTKSGRWISAHAADFGFIVRYPKGKEKVTGYLFEPWHLRYVGTALALEMKARSVVTLEELFSLPAAPGYA